MTGTIRKISHARVRRKNDFIEAAVTAIGNNVDVTYGLKGKSSSWGDMVGSAGQYVTPLGGEDLIRIGIIN